MHLEVEEGRKPFGVPVETPKGFLKEVGLRVGTFRVGGGAGRSVVETEKED